MEDNRLPKQILYSELPATQCSPTDWASKTASSEAC